MVSNSRNKHCKTVSCLIFKEKLLCYQQKLFFWLVKNSCFHLSDISGCENSSSVKLKRILNELFIPTSGHRCPVQLKEFFFQSFVETFEIRRWQFLLVETDFLASRNYFFLISQILPLMKAIFFLVETHFQTNPPIRIFSKSLNRH